ncbi:uncharacterized protein G2W53_045191 [Senna tora]|uniref:Uncharacterized protein n=1 Tax=Senna tora TaxID=362788 RepID=A0A834W161_9FABA|nr:uncharacterized protein G2W53_045191 [Senna tora]
MEIKRSSSVIFPLLLILWREALSVQAFTEPRVLQDLIDGDPCFRAWVSTLMPLRREKREATVPAPLVPVAASSHRRWFPYLRRRRYYCKISVFKNTCQAKGRPEDLIMSHAELHQARMYVLQNCEEVSPFLQKYMDNQALTSNDTDYVTFLIGFKHMCVFELCAEKKATDELISLAVGPDKVAKLYPMIMVNGFRFHTRARALGKKTQNSGILVKGDDLDTAKEYYGVLDHIYELSYMGNRKTSPRDHFDMPDEDVVGRDEQGEAYQQSRTELNVQTNDEIDDDITVTLHRVDIDP